MNTNIILAKDTMTYAEYINSFVIKRSIKKHLILLSFPLDEIPQLSVMSEEELFLRKWDIENFGFNLCKNDLLSNLWIQKEINRFID